VNEDGELMYGEFDMGFFVALLESLEVRPSPAFMFR